MTAPAVTVPTEHRSLQPQSAAGTMSHERDAAESA